MIGDPSLIHVINNGFRNEPKVDSFGRDFLIIKHKLLRVKHEH